jgi:hypothetical protein
MAEDDESAPAPRPETAPPTPDGYSKVGDYVLLAVLAVVLAVLLVGGVIALPGT